MQVIRSDISIKTAQQINDDQGTDFLAMTQRLGMMAQTRAFG
jgi:hypothetical protein